MSTYPLTNFLLWFCVLEAAIAIPSNSALQAVRSDRTSDAETFHLLRRAVHVARTGSSDDVYTFNTTYLTKSWADATLFQYVDG